MCVGSEGGKSPQRPYIGRGAGDGQRKEQVIKAPGDAAMKLRQRLGESLASVQKYDAPPENVTTPSLEALQAYSLGRRRGRRTSIWLPPSPSSRRPSALTRTLPWLCAAGTRLQQHG